MKLKIICLNLRSLDLELALLLTSRQLRIEAEKHRMINRVDDEALNVEHGRGLIPDIEVNRSEAQAHAYVD